MNIHAHAKINLGLHIVGKRTDGYHEINTIFHRIGLYDEITFQHHSSIELTCTNPTIPLDSKNLCWRAAELLQKVLEISNGVKIEILKNIPVGAGLGGGSSDAAAVLRHLPTFWNTSVDETILEQLALQLGSDVPYFLKNSTAYAEGRGEKLSYFQFQLPYWIVLVYPNIHVSTPWAYKTLSEKRNGVFNEQQDFIRLFLESPLQNIRSLKNDFEEVVLSEYPVIAETKNKLNSSGAHHALMSGSGSSVFGLFKDKQKAEYAAQQFDKTYFVHITEPDFIIK